MGVRSVKRLLIEVARIVNRKRVARKLSLHTISRCSYYLVSQ